MCVLVEWGSDGEGGDEDEEREGGKVMELEMLARTDGGNVVGDRVLFQHYILSYRGAV